MKNVVVANAADIRQEIFDLGCTLFVGPRDAKMALPHVEFLAEMYNFTKGLPYIPEAYDCDDFSYRFVSESSLAMARSGVRSGHAIMLCVLTIKEGLDLNGVVGMPGESHETIIVKCADGKWRFFEPQNGRITDVDQAMDTSVDSIDLVIM